MASPNLWNISDTINIFNFFLKPFMASFPLSKKLSSHFASHMQDQYKTLTSTNSQLL